jgi:CRISPR-associated protein Cas1
VRVLGVPPLADRIVERALLRVLDPMFDPRLLPWSFVYRRGLGVRDALAALAEARDCGASWVARGDIEDCFANIPQWEVTRRLREVVDDQRVVHLVGLLLDRPVAGGRTSLGKRGLGLHQAARSRPCSATCTWTPSTGRCKHPGEHPTSAVVSMFIYGYVTDSSASGRMSISGPRPRSARSG